MRLNEIYPGLVASDFYLTTEDGENHVLQAWLWKDHGSMKNWTDTYGVGEISETCGACFSDVEAISYAPCQFIGHLHFLKNSWDFNDIAHEIQHAMFRYIKVTVNDFAKALYLNWMEDLEKLCYESGNWAEWLHEWLWKHNPYGKWVEGESQCR